MFSNLSGGDILIVIISLLISIGVHEATHAFVAHKLGDSTAYDEGRITLNPLKHVDLFMTVLLPAALLLLGLPPIFVAKPVPFDPHQLRHGEYGAAMMAVAGPFSNLALAVIGAVIIRLGWGVDLTHALVLFMAVNISLFVFNMLPIPPLDGSRLFYAFAPEPVQRVMYQIEAMGFMVLILVLLLLSPVLSPVLNTIYRAIFQFLL
jgi:Zn-dependent protease